MNRWQGLVLALAITPNFALWSRAEQISFLQISLAELAAWVADLREKVRATPVPISPKASSLPPAITLLPPIIDKISPTRGGAGTRVTIKGSGFLPTGNQVYTGYGPLYLPSSDGKTMSFVFSPPSLPADFSKNVTAYLNEHQNGRRPELTFGIYVRNSQGESPKPALFKLEL